MITIGFKDLQAQLATVFSQWYPKATAIELAAMHAQLHFDFAASVGQVELADGRSVNARVPEEALPKRRYSHRKSYSNRTLAEPGLHSEFIELMKAIGRPLTQTEIAARLKVFGATEEWVGDVLQTMIAGGEVHKLGGHPSKYVYGGHLPAATVQEVKAAIADVRRPVEPDPDR